jgi:hypothetical protein
MNLKELFLAATVTGGLFAASALSAGVVISPLVTESEFVAPAPTKVVAPANIPRHYQNETIRVSLTVDADGRARNVDLLDGRDPNLVRHLLPAVAQWQFKPALKDGRPVSAQIILPVQLVDSPAS